MLTVRGTHCCGPPIRAGLSALSKSTTQSIKNQPGLDEQVDPDVRDNDGQQASSAQQVNGGKQ
jgi:hypothetical protein